MHRRISTGYEPGEHFCNPGDLIDIFLVQGTFLVSSFGSPTAQLAEQIEKPLQHVNCQDQKPLSKIGVIKASIASEASGKSPPQRQDHWQAIGVKIPGGVAQILTEDMNSGGHMRNVK